VSAWRQPHEDPVYESERRSAYREPEDDYNERADPQIRFRNLAATLLTFCLGLAILYLGFGLVGAADFGDSIGFTIGAIVLATLWVLGAWQRSRKGAYWVTRNERERRGF
jgi:ABC-type transport system involved in cytochrome bd biosynthesis fused ATPase/permease subunit